MLPWFLPHIPFLAVLALVAVVAVVAGLRLWLIRRELARRVVWRCVAADDFDPGREDVVRFARQLSVARRALLAGVVRPAAAVRVRLVAGEDGVLAYELGVPVSGVGVVRAAMFPEVRLVPVDEDEVGVVVADDADAAAVFGEVVPSVAGVEGSES